MSSNLTPMTHTYRPDLAFVPVVIALFVFASVAQAQPVDPSAAPKSPASQGDPSASPGALASVAAPLPTIPPPQSIALAPADADAVLELDKALDSLASADPKQRESAASILAEFDETMLPAIAAKLIALRKDADRDGMTKLLEEARKAARKDSKREDTEEGDKSGAAAGETGKSLSAQPVALIDTKTTDWLKYVLQAPVPNNPAYRDLVSVLALQRACVAIGTTEGARQIINVYMYFGDLFRIDVQRQLARMSERALPALIEAQYNDSKMVRTWAKRRLDIVGRAIPSEAVSISDNQALADVLRAYGRAREVEAVRVIVSFANSDRLQVRQAAREAIGQIGEPAHWQLRDAYEQLMGDKPPRSWDWRQTARELFGVYDRARLQQVYAAMDEGSQLAEQGKIEQAVVLFDQVLARAPMFERRAQMIPTYVARAKQLEPKDMDAAAAMYRRAVAIDPSSEHANKARSALAVIEAKQLAERGVLDVALLERAVQLDPSNEDAQTLQSKAIIDAQVTQTVWRRYAAAVAIGVVALLAMLVVALVPRRKKGIAPEDVRLLPSRKEPDAPPPPSPSI